jgi:hypothetical protein
VRRPQDGVEARDEGRERGASVVELVIVTSLLLIILGAVFAVVVRQQNLALGESRRTENLNAARAAIATLNRDLAQNVGIVSIVKACSSCVGSSDITFLSQTGSDADSTRVFAPNQVRLYVDAQNRIIEETTPPDDPEASQLTYDDYEPAVRVVGTSVIDKHGLFIFYDDQDPPATTTKAADVASVWITLSIQTTTSQSVAPTVVQNWVWLLQGVADYGRTNPPPPTNVAPTTSAPPATTAPPTTIAGTSTTKKSTTTSKSTTTTKCSSNCSTTTTRRATTTTKKTTTTVKKTTTTRKGVPS